MNDDYRLRELGQFLRSRRERISSTQVGLPYGNRRRTPGLKREEVAQLASVSLTWYAWLEQGRPIKVSEQVLESIGHALLLNDTEMQYIFMLSQLTLTQTQTHPKESQLVSKSIQAVLDKLEPFPSFASDQYWNVIGWNASAKMIFGDFEKMNYRERNTIWRMFVNPDYKALFIEWDKTAQWILSQFRLSCGNYASDPWFKKFVEELSIESNDFRRWWVDHNVAFEEHFQKKLNVQTAGQFIFDFTSFDLSSDPRIKIAVHTPADEETFEKLNVLMGMH